MRRFWWLRPVVILPPIGLILLSIPMLLWIDTYGSLPADIMFEVTYVSLVGWFAYLSRGTLLEPHIKQKKEAIQKEKDDLARHRREERAKIYATELRLLEKGEVTPVLDVWRHDPSLRSRHQLISSFDVCRIDPVAREFEISLQLDRHWTLAAESKQSEQLLVLIRSFLRFLLKEPDFALFRPFAETLFLQVNKLVDDESLHGGSVCVFSLRISFEELEQFGQQLAATELPGDKRFSHGEAVEPHRGGE